MDAAIRELRFEVQRLTRRKAPTGVRNPGGVPHEGDRAGVPALATGVPFLRVAWELGLPRKSFARWLQRRPAPPLRPVAVQPDPAPAVGVVLVTPHGCRVLRRRARSRRTRCCAAHARMIGSTRQVAVWASGHPTDLRKGFDGPQRPREPGAGQDPLSGDCHLFANRTRKRAKVLLWDGMGLCIYAKRLERGRFACLWRAAAG